MVFRRFSTGAVIVATMVLGLTACGSSGSTTSESGGDSDSGISIGAFGGEQLAIGEPVEGGELTWGIWLPIQTLDPAGVMGDSTVLAMKSIFGSLMTANPAGGVEPNLAESLTSDDNLTWTLKLDPEVKFTDGTPLNADAVIAHITKVGAEGSTSTQAGDARKITSMTAEDDHTVVFQLASSNNQFGLMFTENSMGFIPSLTAVTADPTGFATNPVGAGPFKLASFTPGSEVVLEKNPDYKFASDGLPYLDKATLTTVQEEASRIDAVRAGSIDGGTVASVPSLEEARAAGLIGLEQPVYSAYYLILNNENELLSDVRLRTALSMAIDREAVNTVVYEGLHQPMDSILHPSHPLAEGAATWPEFNVEEATALVDEVAQDNGAGEIELSVGIVPGGDSAEVASLVQQMLGAVGVTANVETHDQTAIVGKFAASDYDIALITRPIQPETTTALSQYFQTGSTRNWSHVSIPELDEIFAESSSAVTDEDRLATVPDAVNLLAENVAIVPIVSAGAGRILGPEVAGFPDGDPTTRTIEVFDLQKVWMKE